MNQIWMKNASVVMIILANFGVSKKKRNRWNNGTGFELNKTVLDRDQCYRRTVLKEELPVV